MMKKGRSLASLALLFVLGLTLMLVAGCGQGSDVSYNARTAEEAGFEVLDSSSCEGCHTSPEIISSFEKPKEVAESGEGAGG